MEIADQKLCEEAEVKSETVSEPVAACEGAIEENTANQRLCARKQREQPSAAGTERSGRSETLTRIGRHATSEVRTPFDWVVRIF